MDTELYDSLFYTDCKLDDYQEYKDDRFNELSAKVRYTTKIDMLIADKFSYILVERLNQWYKRKFVFRKICWQLDLDKVTDIKETPLDMGEDSLVQIWDIDKPKYVAFYHRKQLSIERQLSKEALENKSLDLPILFIHFLWKMGLTFNAARVLYHCNLIKEKRIKL